MPFWIEVKDGNGKKPKVIARHDTSTQRTPEPAWGGDRVIPVPEELYHIIGAVRGDMGLARDLVEAFLSVFQETANEDRLK